MNETVPIRSLTEEDNIIFGTLNAILSGLERMGFPVSPGVVVTPPKFNLQTILEHYDLNNREIFEQSLTLIKKDLEKVSPQESFEKGIADHKQFLVNGQIIKSKKDLWLHLLDLWVIQIKTRIWNEGFSPLLTEQLQPIAVFFVNDIEASGTAFFQPDMQDTQIEVKSGQLEPAYLKRLDEMFQEINQKVVINYIYDWILDHGLKIVGIKQMTPRDEAHVDSLNEYVPPMVYEQPQIKSATKIFMDLSTGLTIEKDIDGVYISSEKSFDLNKPTESFEQLVFKLVESALTFPDKPVLMKLADISEGMGRVRGALRLIHQKSLIDPLIEAILFARNKKELKNIYVVMPFVRNNSELMQLKRELAVKNLLRKNNLQIWLELAVPENILNIDEYLVSGVDGVVLNLDELASFLGGFDGQVEEVGFYKQDVTALIKFLEESLKVLHKSKVPFIAYGNLVLDHRVLDFLVEHGVYGVVVERYETASASEILHKAEHRMVLRRTS